MPRIWFGFPRIFGIRPGISFALSELTKKPSRKRGAQSLPDTPEPQQHAEMGAAFEASGLSCRMILIFASLAVSTAITLAFLA